MTKTRFISMAAVLASALLAACGGGEATSSTPSNPTGYNDPATLSAVVGYTEGASGVHCVSEHKGEYGNTDYACAGGGHTWKVAVAQGGLTWAVWPVR
jgi:hypothetical protein